MHGQEHFYEVAVKEKNSIVKVYDSTAKLRMSRRISLPKGNPVPCENFLIFYDESYITLVDVIAI